MADKPLIFSASMIRALLAGTKTQTRRKVRFPIWAAGCFDDPLKVEVEADEFGRDPEVICNDTGCLAALPLPWQIGDRLWVRETFVMEDDREYAGTEPLPSDGRPIQYHEHPEWGRWHKIPHYRATEPEPHIVGNRGDQDDDRTRWSPPIHMPRWASRLTLTVTNVRVERLQDISEADAVAEGTQEPTLRDVGGELAQAAWSERQVYARLWNSIHGPDAWAENPWVAALTFTVDPRNIDATPNPGAHDDER